jgi:hypothetical protein
MSKAALCRREWCFHCLHGKTLFQNLVVVQDVQKLSGLKKKKKDRSRIDKDPNSSLF